MTESTPAANAAKTIRLIHFALFTGVFLAGVALVVVGMMPNAPPRTGDPMLGFGLTAVGAMAIAIAFALLRRRIPSRGSDESSQGFWRAETVQAAIVLWAVIEAGGLLGVVGYAVTGMWSPLALVPISIIAGFLVRPGVLEGQ